MKKYIFILLCCFITVIGYADNSHGEIGINFSACGDSVSEPAPKSVHEAPRYWSLHTNLLYDIVLIPNIGVEFYLGNNISLGANWWYGWWNSNCKNYFQTYGGLLAGRYWFGKAAQTKPLSGHHLGVYGQMLQYDLKWKGTGYMSGEPGKNITNKPTWSVGIEYGFSLPIRHRLNLDFSIGIGYLQGQYMKYKLLDNHYVWQSTLKRRWFGPTKLEVSLIWLFGARNVNEKRGGCK